MSTRMTFSVSLVCPSCHEPFEADVTIEQRAATRSAPAETDLTILAGNPATGDDCPKCRTMWTVREHDALDEQAYAKVGDYEDRRAEGPYDTIAERDAAEGV
jgi:hypothetical protein